MAKRTRPHVITLRVNDAELALIEERMQQAGIINREAYLRRAAINCYLLSMKLPEVKETLALLQGADVILHGIGRADDMARSREMPLLTYRELLADIRKIHIKSIVKANDVTGVEMEALTGVSVAALTVYDMCKAVSKGMVIDGIRLLRKTGGKSGDYIASTPIQVEDV